MPFSISSLKPSSPLTALKVGGGGGGQNLLNILIILTLAGGISLLAPSETRLAQAISLPPTDNDALFTDVNVGDGFTCAVTAGKNIRCWGNAALGPLYFSGDYAQVVTADNFYSCARTSGGAVHCWSFSNTYLPNLPKTDHDDDTTTPDIPVTFSQIVSTSDQSTMCGLLDGQNSQDAGTVQCWGVLSTQIADEINTEASGKTFSAIALGLQSFCGILVTQNSQTAGVPECYRVITTNNPALPTIPDEVATAKVSGISVGSFFACALLRDGDDAGEMRCWGESSQLAAIDDAIPADDDQCYLHRRQRRAKPRLRHQDRSHGIVLWSRGE